MKYKSITKYANKIPFSTYSIEPIVDKMLEIFTHANLSHQLVFVSVHARQLTHVSVDVLQTVRQLEGIHVAQAVLDVTVNDQLGETQDLATQMEGVTETGLLTLLLRDDNLKAFVLVSQTTPHS